MLKCIFYFFKELITKLSEEDYNEHIESLKTSLTEEPKKLADEVDNYWRAIQDKRYYFDRCEFKFMLLLTIHNINRKIIKTIFQIFF